MSRKLREFEEPSFNEKVKSLDDKINSIKDEINSINDEINTNKLQANTYRTIAGKATGQTSAIVAKQKKEDISKAEKSSEVVNYLQQDKLKSANTRLKSAELEKANLLKNKNIQQENTMANLTKQDILRILESSESARMTKSELVETISNKLLKENMNDDLRRKIDSGENDYSSSHLDRDTVKRMADNIMNDIRSNLQAKTGGGADFNAAQSVLMQGLMSALQKENRNKQQLEQLAIRLVREEYNLPEDAVDIDAKIMGQTPIRKQGLKMKKGNKRPPQGKTEEQLKPNVTKRRLMNAMMHGAARKGQNLFHMASEELNRINPSLVQDYSKMMAGNDFMYWAMNDETIAMESEHGTHAGQVRVVLSETGGNPKIVAEGMTFPFLLHELTKGALELLSLWGLDEDPQDREYVLDKTDNLESEPWDIRLGPKIWEKFLEALGDDIDIKSNVYAKLSTLSPSEFNSVINGLLNDKDEAKNKVKQIADEIRGELNQEEVDTALGQFGDEGYGEEHDGETPTAGEEEEEDPLLKGLLNKPSETEEDGPETWSKSELERGIDDALDAGDYATVRMLTDILNNKY